MAGVAVVFAAVERSGTPLRGLDLDLPAGEVLALLGPAGAGKTAALRLAAGLDRAERGSVLVGGRSPGGWRPPDAPCSFMVPPASLPPRRTLAEAVAEPLALPARDRAARVARALTLVGLDGQDQRPIGSLAPLGRLRAALARALAAEAPLLLLDDPLAGLPPAERAGFAQALRPLLRQRAHTVLIATREGAEAMTLADRIAVLEAGRIAQCGPPRTLYETPETLLVASLMGEANRLPGTVQWLGAGECGVQLDCGPAVEARAGDLAGPGSRCLVLVRPERVAVAALSAEEMGEGALPAAVRDVVFLGDHVRVALELGRGGWLVARRPPAGRLPRPGGPAAVAWDAGAAIAFRAFA